MPVERRERAIAIDAGQPATGGTRCSMEGGQPSRDGTSRMTREYQVQFCERLGVKFPGPTRQLQVLPRRSIAVRFTSESSRNSDKVALTLSARNGLMHRSKQHRYSITSSARPSSESGKVMPSV